MRTSTIGGCLVLALSLAACDGTPITPPEPHAPETQPLLSHGGKPIETTMVFTATGAEVLSVTQLPSGIVMLELIISADVTGDWEGTATGTLRQTIHINGMSTGKAIYNFNGTVLGLEGTVEFRHVGTVKADGTCVCKNTILRGTGELANLRGQGENWILAPGVLEGVFHVHFIP